MLRCNYKLVTAVIISFSAVWMMSEKALADSVFCLSDKRLPIKKVVVDRYSQDGRKIRVWVGFPDSEIKNASYLVFSHGAFSAPDHYEELLLYFVKNGYVVVAPWHVDSESIEKNEPLTKEKNWLMRRSDMNEFLPLPTDLRSFLKTQGVQVDINKAGVVGHSYGAFTAQVFAGAQAVDYEDGVKRGRFNSVVKAVLAYSPPGPMNPFIPEDAWADMAVPSMVVTGTKDTLPGFIDDWKLHLTSFNTAPSGDNWAYVGRGVDHYFGGIIGRLSNEKSPQREGFSRAKNLSVAFMNAYLKGDKNSLDCLNSMKDKVDDKYLFNFIYR